MSTELKNNRKTLSRRGRFRFLPAVLIVLIFLLGIGFVSYPLLSNQLYEKEQAEVTSEYDEAIQKEDDAAINEEWQKAYAYNEDLQKQKVVLTEPFDPNLDLDPSEEPYASILNINGDGIMGYLDIPKIDVRLSIYHGTTQDILKEGVGHLQSTSLPCGGDSSHTVLTGHTGLPGKRLFTDLALLEVGDVFYIHILNEVHAYQVFSIDVVEPEDTSLLHIQQGKDLATLLTCTPYGLNTHRLLVRGERIPYEEAEEAPESSVKTESIWEKEYKSAILYCLAIYVPLTVLLLLIFTRKSKKKKDHGSN